MSKLVIVVGDTHTGGGQVITGSTFTNIDGLPVARVNDMALCLLHRGTFPIAVGDFTFIVDGEAVARHGDKLACGCMLISGRQFRVYIDDAGVEKPTHSLQAAKQLLPETLSLASFGKPKVCEECLKEAAKLAPAFLGR